jgi:hypothetical protein
MKKLTYWLLATSFTFILGVAIALLWVNFNYSEMEASNVLADSKSQPIANLYADLPILNYCELANNPEKYDGKIVRINAKLYGHYYPEPSFLDENCYAKEKETVVTFDNKDMKAEVYKYMPMIGGENARYLGFPKIVAVGKFSRVNPPQIGNNMVRPLYLRFEVISLEKVSPPKNGRKYVE